MGTDRHDLDLDSYDEEILQGHYLIASMDGRLDDQDLLGQELIRRGRMSESFHQKNLRASREREPLPRPIIAGPHDTQSTSSPETPALKS